MTIRGGDGADSAGFRYSVIDLGQSSPERVVAWNLRGTSRTVLEGFENIAISNAILLSNTMSSAAPWLQLPSQIGAPFSIDYS